MVASPKRSPNGRCNTSFRSRRIKSSILDPGAWPAGGTVNSALRASSPGTYLKRPFVNWSCCGCAVESATTKAMSRPSLSSPTKMSGSAGESRNDRRACRGSWISNSATDGISGSPSVRYGPVRARLREGWKRCSTESSRTDFMATAILSALIDFTAIPPCGYVEYVWVCSGKCSHINETLKARSTASR